MKLRKISKDRIGGFTLIEILIVFGIAGVVFSMTPLFDLMSVNRGVQNNVYHSLIYTLIKSRSIAMRTNTMSGVSFLGNSEYTLFAIDDYGEDIVLDTVLIPRNFSLYSECERVVFDALGRTENECDIQISYGVASTSVMIGYEGNIE